MNSPTEIDFDDVAIQASQNSSKKIIRNLVIIASIAGVLASALTLFITRENLNSDNKEISSTAVIISGIVTNLLSALCVTLFTNTVYLSVRRLDERFAVERLAALVVKKLRIAHIKDVESVVEEKFIGLKGVDLARDSEKIKQLIGQSVKCVWILNWWDPQLTTYIDALCAAAKRGVNIRLCFQDPETEMHRSFSIYLHKRLSDCLNHIRDSIRGNLTALGASGKKLKGVQLRLFRTNITGPIMIIDNEIIFGLYLHDHESPYGPQFTIDVNTDLGRKFVSEFEHVWRERATKEIDIENWSIREIDIKLFDCHDVSGINGSHT